jgi:hypothetical protein
MIYVRRQIRSFPEKKSLLKSERIGLNGGPVLADVLGDLGHAPEVVQLGRVLESVQVVLDPVRGFVGKSLKLKKSFEKYFCKKFEKF